MSADAPTSDPATIFPSALSTIDLAIEGMTCGSCAVRIEKKLNRLAGAEAAVNYATETAEVTISGSDTTPEMLVDAVKAAGYQATVIGATSTAPAGAAGTASSYAGPDMASNPGGANIGPAQHDASTVDPTPADTAGGYHAHSEDVREGALTSLRQRLFVSALLTIPTVAMSMIPGLQFRNWQWMALTLASPVVVWGAWPFHEAAAKNLRHGAATMDTLISVGTLSAFGYSLWALFFGHAGMAGMEMSMGFEISRNTGGEHIYLEAAAAVTTLILLGRYLEARAKFRAGDAIRTLLTLGVTEVTILESDGTQRRIAIDNLAVGQRFVVRPGERVATDGVVVEGQSEVDNSLVTGESVPVHVGVGDAVIGATVNCDGMLTVEATRVGADTALSQIARLVRQAQMGKTQVQRLADRISAVFVPTVIAISVVTLIVWLASGRSTPAAVSAAVSVLIIACPCALGLATPTALMVGTGRAAQLGIIIRGVEVLENTRAIDTVVMDKTGTITTGDMSVVDVTAFGSSGEPAGPSELAQNLAVLASVESAANHPIARAVVSYAEAELPAFQPADVGDMASLAGGGVRATVAGAEVFAGSQAFVRNAGFDINTEVEAVLNSASSSGHTVVVAAWDEAVRLVCRVADAPKDNSADAIARMRELGLHPVMLTGDNAAAAASIASQVGIDDVIADVRPDGKVDALKRLQASGKVVAMVGDGINDAAALAQADLGLAMGTGADAAIEASDLTIVSGDLGQVSDAIRLSRRTLGVIKGNLFWAFAYNVAAIPLAAFGYLNPTIAGAAMAMSSVFVVSNSLRLRSFSPKR